MIDPHSSETIGYSLFLEPSGDVADEASLLIGQLASEHGGPVFIPHVTLLGWIDSQDEENLMRKASMLAESTAPFALTLERLDAEDQYFRALYMRVTEQEDMLALHRKASEIFSMEPSPAFVAHMSLLYGNYPLSVKETIVRTLDAPLGETFAVKAAHLYRTDGEVSDWRKIGEFDFKG
jgi:2'-5' RNA ligase